MPKYKHEREDFTWLLEQLQNQRKEDGELNQPQTEVSEVPKSSPEVSPEARRRASLLSNPKMKYIISKATGEQHDRDCPRAAKIADVDFDMVEDCPESADFCRACRRKAVIREGLPPDLKNKIDIAYMLFNKMNAPTGVIHALFHWQGGRILRIEMDSIYVKVRDDTWLLRYTEEGNMLYHNNYFFVDGKTRIISSGFHLQVDHPLDFYSMYAIMKYYSWEGHIQKTEEVREEEHENERRDAPAIPDNAEQCENAEKKENIPRKDFLNFRRIPILSFQYTYFVLASDDDDFSKRIHQNGLNYQLVLRWCHPKRTGKYAIYRARKKMRNGFCTMKNHDKDCHFCLKKEKEENR